MKVLLLKDVYNLGRAGEVKKVANGYGRNFLIPQKLALLATPGALKQVERLQAAAAEQRKILNEEMAGLAEKIAGLQLNFKAKVGETGRLYGSITQQMIADAISEQIAAQVDRHWIESQPVREEGEHIIKVRLTYDLIPEVKVIVESEKEEKAQAKEEKSKRKAKPQQVASEPTTESSDELIADAPAEEIQTEPTPQTSDEQSEE